MIKNASAFVGRIMWFELCFCMHGYGTY